MKSQIALCAIFVLSFWSWWQEPKSGSVAWNSLVTGTGTVSDMLPAIAHHHPSSHVVNDDWVSYDCPEGYEGHFVDINAGFEGDTLTSGTVGTFSDHGTIEWNGPMMFTVCFKKEFMDELRKHPDMMAQKPHIHPA